MAKRAQRNQNDRDEDAAALDVASNVLRSLVLDVTKAMMNATVNATVPVAVTSKNIKYSSAIDPYNDE